VPLLDEGGHILHLFWSADARYKALKRFSMPIEQGFEQLLSDYKNLAFHNTGRYIIKVRDVCEQKFLMEEKSKRSQPCTDHNAPRRN
jgi:hypothetical protein